MKYEEYLQSSFGQNKFKRDLLTFTYSTDKEGNEFTIQ